ncbi:uncharacterized protein V1516DRAFT_678394 [Lipomyces oligophaga]|uniref:uncharacterized protein n=1 Tax=Lipomyces oligophaga TaxID=45792 RepID=UPI0034CF1A6B
MTVGYSMASLKKIIKKSAKSYKIGKSADKYIYLEYLMFIDELLVQAREEATAAGDQSIQGYHIEHAAELVLRNLRG